MDQYDVQMHLAQLTKCIKKSRVNKYSDPRKNKYQEKLNELYEQVSKTDFSSIEYLEITKRKSIIDFIFHSIQFLDNSTLTISPFEIVYCLEKVLEEWIPEDKFIIATSLSNDLNGFYFDKKLTSNNRIYDLIKNEYNIEFEFKLIQISLPRFFVHDYLANVTLYHELGHFIDSHFAISKTIVKNLIYDGKIDIKDNTLQDIEYCHHMEFFADIFAAQYVGNSLSHFINYIAHNAGPSGTHPATKERLEIVDKFLKGVEIDNKIETLKKETLNRTKLNLTNRHIDLSTSDFEDLVPFEINNNIELHSIFLAGWNFWKSPTAKVLIQFPPDRAYKIINNLIEKSISNFIVTESWKRNVPS